MKIEIITSDDPLNDPAVLAVRDKLRAGGQTAIGTGKVEVSDDVSNVIDDVKARGDEAVIEWTNRFDGSHVKSETLRVPPEQLQKAHAGLERGFLKLIRKVVENISEYQRHIAVKAADPVKRGGRTLGVRYKPIDRVGVYVPGWKGQYPSTMLMTVVPAQVAGVPEIAIACPPSVHGDIDPMVLGLAAELGVDEVYRMSGAQAIAALAIGTETIRPVDKIVGPGNAFVAEAKRQVFGRVGIDCTAGPSEVLIVADDTARADWLAADMLAQAEHDPGSAVLVTPSRKLADAVAAAIEEQLPALERKEAIRAALEEYSKIIVVPDINLACEVANEFATEHLQIVTADDEAALAKIRHAGAIFLGAATPVPLGDYYAGPSHVLPTGGTARFFGPLSVNDFLKASSVIRYDQAALAEDTKDVIDFARREGLTAHARAVEIRKPKH